MGFLLLLIAGVLLFVVLGLRIAFLLVSLLGFLLQFVWAILCWGMGLLDDFIHWCYKSAEHR